MNNKKYLDIVDAFENNKKKRLEFFTTEDVSNIVFAQTEEKMKEAKELANAYINNLKKAWATYERIIDGVKVKYTIFELDDSRYLCYSSKVIDTTLWSGRIYKWNVGAISYTLEPNIKEEVTGSDKILLRIPNKMKKELIEIGKAKAKETGGKYSINRMIVMACREYLNKTANEKS